jgi:flavodoxin-like protein
MRALVVFESMFGNTEKVAVAIAEGLAASMPVDVVEVGSAPAAIGAEVTLVVVGGPTHAFGMSRPQTRQDAERQAGGEVVSKSGIREWLDAVTTSAPVPAVAFDTRVKQRWVPGSAARAAQRRLRAKGFAVAGAPRTFYVEKTPGPLNQGEISRARQWGGELAAQRATENTTE